MNRQNRPHKTIYVTVRDFLDEPTKVAIRLQRSNDYPRARYSLQVGRYTHKDQWVAFLPVQIETKLSRVQKLTNYSEIVVGLLRQAEEYIHNEAQLTEDLILESQIAKDEKHINKGKPTTKVTGKTERERNKRKAA